MDLILFLLLLFPISIVILDSLLRFLYLILALKQPLKIINQTNLNTSKKIFYLIVACNEEKVIGQTLTVLSRAMSSNSKCSVGIICDHCTDNTEKIALVHGTKLFIRTDGPLGKGPALSWFVQNYSQVLADQDIIVILDADTLIDLDFYDHIQKPFANGYSVAQAFIQPVFANPTPATVMAAYSELLSQYIDDAARVVLGWSVPLRGTGMAFSTASFKIFFENLSTQVEDIEISIRLAVHKERVYFEPSAVVYDPKSVQLLGLARQRGRWLRGQREILRSMGGNIWKVVGTGLSGLSLIQAFFFKPKTFILGLKLSLWIPALFFKTDSLRLLMLSLIVLSILPDIFYYYFGAKFTKAALKMNSSAINFVLYIILWFISLILSLYSKEKWLRARDDKSDTPSASSKIVHPVKRIKESTNAQSKI